MAVVRETEPVSSLIFEVVLVGDTGDDSASREGNRMVAPLRPNLVVGVIVDVFVPSGKGGDASIGVSYVRSSGVDFVIALKSLLWKYLMLH